MSNLVNLRTASLPPHFDTHNHARISDPLGERHGPNAVLGNSGAARPNEPVVEPAPCSAGSLLRAVGRSVSRCWAVVLGVAVGGERQPGRVLGEQDLYEKRAVGVARVGPGGVRRRADPRGVC